MKKITTFDVLTTITDEQTKKIEADYEELEFNKMSLKRVCELVDDFMDDNDADSFEIGVENETLEISISVICPCFEYVGTDNTFMKIASKAIGVVFETHDEDNVSVSFVFNGIWRSRNEC